MLSVESVETPAEAKSQTGLCCRKKSAAAARLL